MKNKQNIIIFFTIYFILNLNIYAEDISYILDIKNKSLEKIEIKENYVKFSLNKNNFFEKTEDVSFED
jgi:hypothetical protein